MAILRNVFGLLCVCMASVTVPAKADPNQRALNQMRSALSECDDFLSRATEVNANSVISSLERATALDPSVANWDGDYYGTRISSLRVAECSASAQEYLSLMPNREAQQAIGGAVRQCIRMKDGSYTTAQYQEQIDEFVAQLQSAYSADAKARNWNSVGASNVPAGQGLSEFLDECRGEMRATLQDFAKSDASAKASLDRFVAAHQARAEAERQAEEKRIQEDEALLRGDRLDIYRNNNRLHPSSAVGVAWHQAKRWVYVTRMNGVACTRVFNFSGDSLSSSSESVGCSLH